MTRIEKIVIGATVVAVVGIGILSYRLAVEIDEAGGIRGIVVEAGKDIKSIVKEINDE